MSNLLMIAAAFVLGMVVLFLLQHLPERTRKRIGVRLDSHSKAIQHNTTMVEQNQGAIEGMQATLKAILERLSKVEKEVQGLKKIVSSRAESSDDDTVAS